jgi:hypothetical protein
MWELRRLGHEWRGMMTVIHVVVVAGMMRARKGEQFTPELLWLSRSNGDPRIVAEPSPNLSREKNGRGTGKEGEELERGEYFISYLLSSGLGEID